MTAITTTRVVRDACGGCYGRKVVGQQTPEGPVTAIGWQPISGALNTNRKRVYVTHRTNHVCPIKAVSGITR